MLEYSEMVDKTNEFYDKYKIKIKDNNIELAVASLTMTEYAKIFNDKHPEKQIDNQDALSTVGDAVCSVYLMKLKYKKFITQEELTNYKVKVRNENLNIIGERLLKNYLFYANFDLKDENKKSYATAFEAVVGFIAMNNNKDIKRFLKNNLD